MRWRSRQPTHGTLLPRLVPAFSPVAIACVATLVSTGLFASWLHLGGIRDLVTTRYGRTLAVKLVLVAGVMALGALNWRRLARRLDGPDGADQLRRTAAAEVLLGQVVLFVTAMLVRTPPAEM